MLKDLDNRMQKSIGALKSELASIRTGRANAALLDHVKVSYYGSEVPMNQIGNLSVPEPRMLMIAPWEKNLIADIEKAIMKSDLGLTPTSDGEVVRIMLPELTEERRRDLVKQVKNVGEKAKVSIRSIRRDANDNVKHQVKDEGLPEDESKRLQDQVQKVTDKFIAEIDEIIEHKEAEILTV